MERRRDYGGCTVHPDSVEKILLWRSEEDDEGGHPCGVEMIIRMMGLSVEEGEGDLCAEK
jgi:hypothetical protein